MRVLIQRVLQAAVSVDGKTVGQIDRGYLLLVGASGKDDKTVAEKMAQKVAEMRLFRDPDGPSHFHLSLQDVRGEALVVSQFTLFADTRKGRRPSFIQAAEPAHAERLIEHFGACLQSLQIPVQTGRFGANMQVQLVNDGPVTIWLDSDDMKRHA